MSTSTTKTNPTTVDLNPTIATIADSKKKKKKKPTTMARLGQERRVMFEREKREERTEKREV